MTDLEQKRKTIGALLIDVFPEHVQPPKGRPLDGPARRSSAERPSIFSNHRGSRGPFTFPALAL